MINFTNISYIEEIDTTTFLNEYCNLFSNNMWLIVPKLTIIYFILEIINMIGKNLDNQKIIDTYELFKDVFYFMLPVYFAIVISFLHETNKEILPLKPLVVILSIYVILTIYYTITKFKYTSLFPKLRK